MLDYHEAIRRHIDSALTKTDRTLLFVPEGGWIEYARRLLTLRVTDVGTLLGIGHTGVTHAKQREPDGTMTIGRLREVADAMGCRVVYSSVPKEGSWESTKDHVLRTLGPAPYRPPGGAPAATPRGAKRHPRRETTKAAPRGGFRRFTLAGWA